MTTASTGEHGIIGNMRSAALVNVFGAIDFFCFPEFDSPSVFASLLDSERAGSFSIRPAGEPRKGSQIYLPTCAVHPPRTSSVLELTAGRTFCSIVCKRQGQQPEAGRPGRAVRKRMVDWFS